MGRNSIICLDAMTLNMLYIDDGRVSLGITYDKNIRKLVRDLRSYDDFELVIVMYPLMCGEGDVVIPELEYNGLQFNALSKELADIQRFIQAVGNPRCKLVNGLDCVLHSMRMPSYNMAISYGDRVAVLCVKDNTLSDISLYDTKKDMMDSCDIADKLYGDVDLYDVDRVKALHPELKNFSKTELAPIVPLLSSTEAMCFTEFKADDLTQGTDSDLVHDETPEVIDEPEMPEVAETSEDASEKSSGPPKKTHKVRSKRKPKGRGLNIFVTLCCMVYSIVLGASIATFNTTAYKATIESTMRNNQEEKTISTSILDSFRSGLSSIESKARSASGVYRTVYGLGIRASVASIEFNRGTYTLQVYLESTSDIDSITKVLGENFEILSSDLVGEVKLNERVLQSYSIAFR